MSQDQTTSPIGIFAKTFSGHTPLAVLSAAKAAGFNTVQYNLACSGLGALPQAVSDSAATEIAIASQQTGVALAAVSATYNMIHPDLAMRQAGRRSFLAIAAQAQAMGTKLITLCTGSCDAKDQWRHHPDNNSDESWRTMISEFEKFIAIAEAQDIYLGVEPELANVVSSAAKARQLIDEMKSPRLRIVFDAANLFERVTAAEQRRIIEQSATLLSGHIAMAHAKDRKADGSFAAAGQGTIDFKHYFTTLKAAGFVGDIISHGLAADEAAGVAAFLKTQL